MVKFKNKLGYIFLIMFCFCGIFTPDFWSFSIRYLVVIVAMCGLVWEVFNRGGRIIFNEQLLSVFKGFIPFIIYFTVIQLARIVLNSHNAGEYGELLTHTLLAILSAFIIAYFLSLFCIRKKFDFDTITKIVIAVMVIQLVCVILAVTVPDVRTYFNSFIIRNSHSDRIKELVRVSSYEGGYRSYGLSNNLFDSFGYITGMLIVLIYAYGMEKKDNKLILLSAVMIVMPLVNSRTGVVIVLLGYFVVSLFYNYVESVSKIAGLIVVAIVALPLLMNYLPTRLSTWIKTGLQETMTLLEGSGSVGTYAEILNNDIVFPSDVFLGMGNSPSVAGYSGIDNGYINCIWHFGIFGSLLLFAGIIHMFRLAYRASTNKFGKAVSVSYVIIYFVYLLKIYSIDNYGGNVIVFCIPILMILLSKQIETDDLAKTQLERE